VTDIPGTTRDLLTESVDIGGVPVVLVDTAGLHRAVTDPIEREGIARAHAARQAADVIIVVLDGSRPRTADDDDVLAASAASRRVVVVNKSDLPAAWAAAALDDRVRTVAVSARTGAGIEALRAAIWSELAAGDALRETPAITNVRHAELLLRARAALQHAAAAAVARTPEEFVAADVNEARALLEEVTGARTPDEVLHAIFDKFCIGK
jgi:tRNA modification GTPase